MKKDLAGPSPPLISSQGSKTPPLGGVLLGGVKAQLVRPPAFPNHPVNELRLSTSFSELRDHFRDRSHRGTWLVKLDEVIALSCN